MKNSKKKKTEKKKTEKELFFDEMEGRLIQAEKDLKEVKKFAKRIKEINKNLSKLVTYYHTDWLDDYDKYSEKKKGKNRKILGQDSIWDVSQEHYEQKIKIMKTLITAVDKGL